MLSVTINNCCIHVKVKEIILCTYLSEMWSVIISVTKNRTLFSMGNHASNCQESS